MDRPLLIFISQHRNEYEDTTAVAVLPSSEAHTRPCNRAEGHFTVTTSPEALRSKPRLLHPPGNKLDSLTSLLKGAEKFRRFTLPNFYDLALNPNRTVWLLRTSFDIATVTALNSLTSWWLLRTAEKFRRFTVTFTYCTIGKTATQRDVPTARGY